MADRQPEPRQGGSRRTRRRAAAAVGVVVVAATAAGCAGNGRSAVEEAAARFHAAVAEGDGATACDLLAPATRSEVAQAAGKPCPQAVVAERLPDVGEAASVDVFGTAGEVRYGAETTFLGRFPDGWLIVAAGCTPKPPHPYDCTVSGG